MADNEVLQTFIADIQPYLDAIEEGVREAKSFADANLEAKAGIDEMRNAAAEADGATHELSGEEKDLRDSLIEAAFAARAAADEFGKLRDAEAGAAAAGGAAGGAGLLGVLGSLIGLLAGLGPIGWGVVAALVAMTVGGLAPVILLLPVIAAGFVGFAAVAVPEIHKVWTAISQGGAALKKLDPQERALVGPIRDLKSEFGQLAKAVQPEVLAVLAEGLKVIKDLMPAIRPLVKAAGDALAGFLGHIDEWLKSGSGQKFIQWLKVDGVGAIKAFGEFLWGLTTVLGRTFDFLFNFGETVHHVFDIVRHDIAHWADDIITAFDTTRHTISSWGADVKSLVAAVFQWIMGRLGPFRSFWQQHWQEIATIAKAIWTVIVDTVRTAWVLIQAVITAAWAVIGPFLKAALTGLESSWRLTWGIIRDVTVTVWNVIKAVVTGAIHIILDVIGAALALLTGHWHQAWSDMVNAASAALHTIVSVVKSILGGLVTIVYDIGRNIVQGLINGMESLLGAVGSIVSKIAGAITGGLSHLLGIGSPSRITYQHGIWIAQGLANGMLAGRAMAAAAAAQLGAVAVPRVGSVPLPAFGPAGAGRGAAGAGGAGGGGFTWTGNVVVNGNTLASKQEVYALVQQAMLDVWTRTRGTGFAPYGAEVH